MLFHTLEFAILLAAVWPAYLLLRRLDLQNYLLVAASYLFYGWWEWRYIPLLLFSTLVDFVVGRALDRSNHAGRRRQLLIVSCVANLGLLGFFKYWDLFASTSNGIGAWLGRGDVLPELHILLPIGISFYTFQSLAYTIDVYRGRFPAWKSFPEFAAYISFFPQLVAGPIERPQNLLRAMGAPRRVTWEGIEEGAFLFAQGWLIKAIADIVGGIADATYSDPAIHSPWLLLWGDYAFLYQLYGDFFGYSQMARGIARLFGFRLMENFRVPIFAPNVREFWARWHVSLTSWLRDYLFFSLGGSRAGPVRALVNMLLTMILAGLWHGSAWHFVAWGATYGMVLILYQVLLHPSHDARHRYLTSRPLQRGVWTVLSIFCTINAFVFSGILFRAQESPGGSVWQNVVDHVSGLAALPGAAWQWPPLSMWVISIVIVFDLLQLKHGGSYWSQRWPWPLRGAVIAVMVAGAIVFDSPNSRAFIYFQF